MKKALLAIVALLVVSFGSPASAQWVYDGGRYGPTLYVGPPQKATPYRQQQRRPQYGNRYGYQPQRQYRPQQRAVRTYTVQRRATYYRSANTGYRGGYAAPMAPRGQVFNSTAVEGGRLYQVR